MSGSYIKLTKHTVRLDGFNARDIFVVDAITPVALSAKAATAVTTALSCGTSYGDEVRIAREHAARRGVPVVDEVAVVAQLLEQAASENAASAPATSPSRDA